MRKSPAGISLLALNTDNEAKTATLRLLQPGTLRVTPDGTYKALDLLSGKILSDHITGQELLGRGLNLSLQPYQGVIVNVEKAD